jgi:hypothetical protein
MYLPWKRPGLCRPDIIVCLELAEDGLLVEDEFRAALMAVDRKIKILPATAQVC